jgi:hypothetical protein
MTPPGQPGLPTPPPDAGGQPVAGQANTNNAIIFICRAVDLTKISGDPSANSEIAYAVENEIKSSPLVDPKATQLAGQITPDEANGTFTFTVNVTPLNPLNF